MPNLTDQEIRLMFKELSDTITNVGLNVAVFETLLLKKSYLTEPEISAAIAEVRAEGKAATARIQDAIRRGPPEGVQ